MEQPVPLLVHGWREQLAKLRPAKEQLGVEEAHRLVASVRDVAEGLLDGRDRRVRPGHSILRNSIGLLAWPRFPHVSAVRARAQRGLPRSGRKHPSAASRRLLWIGRGRAWALIGYQRGFWSVAPRYPVLRRCQQSLSARAAALVRRGAPAQRRGHHPGPAGSYAAGSEYPGPCSTSAPATRTLSLCGDSARLPSPSRRHPPDLGTSLKLSPVAVGELTWLSVAGHHCLPSRSSAYSPQTHEHVGYLYDPIRLDADRAVRMRNFI